MTVVTHFPKTSQLHLKEDPMARFRDCLKTHGFDGKKRYFWITITIVKILCLILRSVYVFTCLNQPRRVADLTASFPAAITGLLKLLHLYFDKPRVDYLYATIAEEFWDHSVCGPEVEKRAAAVFSFTQRVASTHFGVSCICMLMFIWFPVADMPTDEDRILPNVIWSPFDLNPSPLYETAFAVLLANIVMTVMGNIFYDFFYVYCVQHLYVQFMLLKAALANVAQGVVEGAIDDAEKFNSEYFQATIMERLKICAEHHARLLKFGRNIEAYCSKVLVWQLVMTYASLVVNGFIISVERSFKSTILFNLSVSTVVQLSLFALLSSELNQQSLAVIDAVYESDWYLFDAAMKKACTFMVMNSRKGIVIKAGGSTRIDNALVIDMLQRVFSAITLLKALVE